MHYQDRLERYVGTTLFRHLPSISATVLSGLNAQHDILVSEYCRDGIDYRPSIWLVQAHGRRVDQWDNTSSGECLAQEHDVWSDVVMLVAEHLPGVRLAQLEGTYLAWLDFTTLGLDDPAAYFLSQAKVALSEGALYGAGGTGHARLNFATHPEILAEIVERMGKATTKLAG